MALTIELKKKHIKRMYVKRDDTALVIEYYTRRGHPRAITIPLWLVESAGDVLTSSEIGEM